MWTPETRTEFVLRHRSALPVKLSNYLFFRGRNREPITWDLPQVQVAWDILEEAGAIEAHPPSVCNFDRRCSVPVIGGRVVFDCITGVGATPNNANVRYSGFGVMMRPQTYLNLVGGVRNQGEHDQYLATCRDSIGFGPPMLYTGYTAAAPLIQLYDTDLALSGAVRADFINRMCDVEHEILVHVFPHSSNRKVTVTEEDLRQLVKGLPDIPARMFVHGPLFSRAFLGNREYTF